MNKTSWPTKKLGEICDINGGDAAPQDYAVFSSDGVPFVRMQDLGRYHVTDNLIETRDKIKTEAIHKLRIKIFPKGSIILPRSGSVFANHRAILGVDAAVVSHIAILNNYKGVEPKYLFWYLTKLDIGRHAVKTSNVDSISFQRLGKFEIPIPALNIQKQIVERLDKIAEAQKLNDNLISKTGELFQSLLHRELNPTGPADAKAMAGKKDWKAQKLENLLELCDAGVWGKAIKGGGMLVLRSTNFKNDGILDFSNVPELKIEEKKRAKVKLIDGDILLEKSGGGPDQPVGRVAYFTAPDQRVYTFANFVQRLRPNLNLVNSNFLFYHLLRLHNAGYTKKLQSQTTGIRNLKLSLYLKTSIPLPPLETQKKIVAKLSAVQEYKAQLLEQKAKLKELFDSALAKSFK